MNPSAPSMKLLIKLHKPDQSIRRAMNWINAPACKLYRLFTEKIHRIAPLPNAFKIQNTQDQIHSLNDTPLLPHYSLASLDIANL